MDKTFSPLISTRELEALLGNDDLIIIDSAREPTNYNLGHIPGAQFWPIADKLFDKNFSLILKPQKIKGILESAGITNQSHIVVIGEPLACAGWLYWYFKLLGHDKIQVLDGGRKKWIEEKRTLTKDIPEAKENSYKLNHSLDLSLLAEKVDVLNAMNSDGYQILDVRTQQEYSGEIYTEKPPIHGQRAGHIPNSIFLPYDSLLKENGTLLERRELELLLEKANIKEENEVICYCAVGVRSAFVWFVLSELLSFEFVKNYSGSWLEWSNDPTCPIETA